MEYSHIKHGTFISRPNRFIAKVLVHNQEITCHVKNTGRCRELLIPGVTVILEYHPDAKALGRKTSYSLIAVWKDSLLINMDSQIPNAVAAQWLLSGGLPGHSVTNIRREVTFGSSRFDLAFQCDGKPAYMEVKGVTLEDRGIVRFPDAPTVRGVKHVYELIKAVEEGCQAYLLFVVQMTGIHHFEPNTETHKEFAQALKAALAAGVQIMAYDCIVTENSISIHQTVPVILP